MINRIEELVNTPGIVNLELEDYGDINKIILYKKIVLKDNQIKLTKEETNDVNFVIINIINNKFIERLEDHSNYVNDIKDMVQANFSDQILIIYSYFIDKNLNEPMVELFLSNR